jgi:radical SAM superfamily enzyme YgiQ (UPF0313 family)
MREAPPQDFPILLCYRCQYGGRHDFYTRQMPVGLGIMNAALRSQGYDSRLANFSRFTWKEVESVLREIRPRILGVSLFTFNRGAAVKIAELARRVDPGVFIVAGGPHATHLAETVLRHHPAIDAVAVGEGEETLLELAEARSAGRGLEDVRGLAWRGPGSIHRTAPRGPVENLDRFPHPAAHFESIGVDRYAQLEFLITSRGCPARCTFCSTPEFWGTRLRYRSPEHVLEELRILQERTGHVTVSLRDDTFTVDKKRTIDLCRKIIDSGLHLLWDCQSRVNAVDEERLHWMRRAGCQHIQYGVESGSESVLQKLNKGINTDQVVKACDLTRRTGMQLSIYLITGTHGETAEDVAATLRLVRRLRPHDGVVSPLVVYPGTALYEETKRIKGCDDTIWERTRMEGLLVREDSESILAYRQVEATLREVSATSAYTIQELEEHKRTVGSCTAPLLSLGEAYEAEGMTERAAGEYREILARNPESLWGHLRLGNLAEGKGDPAGAAAHYRRAVAAVPRYHLAHSLLGSALRRMGSREESEREFLMALSLYPKDRVARRGLGLLHLPERGSSGRAPSFQRKPSSGLTASPTWPSFLKHPIPDGQPLPSDNDP